MTVYFIKPVGMSGPIKIGHSASPQARLNTLQTGSPVPLEIVALVDGDKRAEGALHRAFSDSRIRREWFHPSPAITETIKSIHNGTFLLELDGARTHTEIVKAAGPAEVVAHKRGVSIHTVNSWKQRDSIPAEHWAAFVADGCTSLQELADYAAQRAPQSSAA